MSQTITPPFSSEHAWLCLTKPVDSYVAERDGYGDLLGQSYSWDDTVPNHAKLQSGDIIAIWDGRALLGVSRIEGISVHDGTKMRRRCPIEVCGSTDVRRRANKSPAYMCAKCKQEFNAPALEEISLKIYTADYGAGWSMTSGIDASACRNLAHSVNSQHSLRSAKPDALRSLINDLPVLQVARFRQRDTLSIGGHKFATVAVRAGQGEFRSKIIEKFTRTCAFTGPNHEAALEAAHLYRYSEHGVHHLGGGLLMRRDIHTLFDRGLIAVRTEVKPSVIDIHPDLSRHPEYASLNGKQLCVDITDAQLHWLALHWKQFRS